MPATSDKDDKQGLVVLPSYGWLALFPYSRSSLFSRYTHFHCFAFFVSFTNVSFLMPGQFWWWRLFTFWERNVPGPLPQRSNRKLESKKFFSMDPGTACHYHGAAGKVDSSGGSFAGFQKNANFQVFFTWPVCRFSTSFIQFWAALKKNISRNWFVRRMVLLWENVK